MPPPISLNDEAVKALGVAPKERTELQLFSEATRLYFRYNSRANVAISQKNKRNARLCHAVCYAVAEILVPYYKETGQKDSFDLWEYRRKVHLQRAFNKEFRDAEKQSADARAAEHTRKKLAVPTENDPDYSELGLT